MADATWPVTLPTKPLIAGANETPPNLSVRSQMDAGPAKVRRRFTAGERLLTCDSLMTGTQVATLDEFYLDTLGGGVLAFNWVNPRTDATVEMRFVQPPSYRPVGNNKYLVSLHLEILP